MLAQVLLCGHAHVGGRDGTLTPSSQTWGKDTWGGGGGGTNIILLRQITIILAFIHACSTVAVNKKFTFRLKKNDRIYYVETVVGSTVYTHVQRSL